MRCMLTLFILCHNRPDDARKAIASAIAQSCTAYKLVISDNSTNDDVEQMVKTHFPHVEYVRRPAGLNAFEHFNLCIDEVATDHFCLFHDDDLMQPDFVETMNLAISRHPDAVAIGCNAYIHDQDIVQEGLSFRELRPSATLQSASELVEKYFGRNQSGIAPFPGYVYKKQIIQQTRFATHAGKYGDVVWLIQLCQRAPIVWVTAPLMVYRLHGQNDGLTESRKDRLKLLGFLKSKKTILAKGLLDDYRIAFIYKPLLHNKSTHGKRHTLAKGFLMKYRIARYFRGSTYQNLISRARIKLGRAV